jgi:Uma2 family endonuclease
MATVAIEPEKCTALEPRQCLVLKNVDWATYRQISDALTEHHARLTYDRGVLELMTLSILHEILSGLIHSFIVVLCEEFSLQFASSGSMTCDREDLDRGAEADESFYFNNEPLIRGKEQIDLESDPPPDLMVEIDLSSSSRRRLGIYAAIKVPEVWKAGRESVKVLQLGIDGEYAPAEESMYFPGIPIHEIGGFVQRRGEMDQLTLLIEFRAWVREVRNRIGPGKP